MTNTNIVPLRTGGQISAIVPTNIEEVFRLAKAISLSGLAPNGMKEPEQITVALLHGMELGLPPMTAVQKIAVINGRPTLWGDAVPALLYARGFKLKEWMEVDTAHCRVTRPDGTEVERTFSRKDAEQAGLWGKAGPWKQYPARMMQMRARGFAARDGAADVLSGLYIREEIEGGELKDVTPPAEATPAPVEIPDIPDDIPSDDPPITGDEAIKYAAKIKDDVAVVKGSDGDLTELQETYRDAIPRLPEDMQEEIYGLLNLDPPT